MAPKRGISTIVADNAKYLLGLDAGNTVIKAVLFDLEGRQVAMDSKNGKSLAPVPGHVERDLSELWQNAQQVIRSCVQKAGITPDRIVAIGCAGHGNGLYLLDRQDNPLLAIQSLDTRAATLAEEIGSAHGDRLHALSLQKPWPSQTPSLLAWIKTNRPELYAAIGTVLFCKDYMTFKLTGERNSDISDMSGSGLLRMPDCQYDDEILALFGLGDAGAFLPRLLEPAAIAGHVTDEAAKATGLAAGTPVVAGYFDVVSSALGSGVVRPGEASIIAGTWSINQVFSSKPVNDPSIFMAAGFAKDSFVNIESSATSAANLEWYVRQLIERGAHHDDPFSLCNDIVSRVKPAADDPFFHPFLYGSGQGAEFRAGYYGLAGWHTEGHLLRALFEGVVFEHRRHVEKLARSGLSFSEAVLSGGGSRSPVWPQMFADCLGVPIRVAQARETGALGAAMGAGIGAGVFESYEAAVAEMTRTEARYLPDTSMKSHYDTRYHLYLRITEAMRPIWSEIAQAHGRGD